MKRLRYAQLVELAIVRTDSRRLAGKSPGQVNGRTCKTQVAMSELEQPSCEG